MVLHKTRPFWALMDHSGTEPGTETFDCTTWNASASLKWIGVAGVPSSTCTWSGGTTANYRGASGASSTTYGSPNSVVDMDGNEAAVTITVAQPVTITGFSVIIEVGWDHLEHNGDWIWTLLVDGAAAHTETCVTKG